MREFTNLIEHIYNNFKDRLRNPIIGTFTISWIAFNWKPIYFLIKSEQLPEKKLLYITENHTDNLNLLLLPLLATAIYVLLLPFFNWGIEKAVEWVVNQRHEIQTIFRTNELGREARISTAEVQRDLAKANALKAFNEGASIESLQKQNLELKELLQMEKNRALDQQQQDLEKLQKIESANVKAVDRLKDAVSILQHEIGMKDKELHSLRKQLGDLTGQQRVSRNLDFNRFNNSFDPYHSLWNKLESANSPRLISLDNIEVLYVVAKDESAFFLDFQNGKALNIEEFSSRLKNSASLTLKMVDKFEFKRIINKNAFKTMEFLDVDNNLNFVR